MPPKAAPAGHNKPASRARVASKPKPVAAHVVAPVAIGQVLLFDVTRIRRNERNSRTHAPEQIKKIAKLIRAHGFTTLPLIDIERGYLLAFGHGRLEAVELIYAEGGRLKMPSGAEVPVGMMPGIDCSGWTEEQFKSAVIADNRSALEAGWSMDVLRGELLWLQEKAADLSWTAFDEAELARWMAPPGNPGLTDADDAPPLGGVAVSKPGDLWICGQHRILCGDATQADAVTRLLDGAKPFLMVTDPPYGVEYDPAWRKRAGLSAKVAEGKVSNDDRADWRDVWALFPGAVAYVWHGGLHAGVVADSLAACKLTIRSQIVWVKTRPVLSRGHFHWQHEPAYFAVKEGKEPKLNFAVDHEIAAYAVRFGQTANWEGDRRQSTVWEIEHLKNDTGHGTQKPVECMRRPMLLNSAPGGAVFDPFLGSGTSVIAAETIGRRAYGMELDPRYVDVAVRRWQAFTGQSAMLDGKKPVAFADVEAKNARAKAKG